MAARMGAAHRRPSPSRVKGAASRAPLWIAVAAAAIVMAATWFSRTHRQPAPQPEAPMQAPQDPAASTQPDAPATNGGAMSRPMTPAARAAIAGIVASRMQTQQQRARTGADTWASAQRTYAAESRDAAWAAGKEQSLRAIATDQVADDAGVAADALALRCARTLCETRAEFATAGAAEDWMLAYMSRIGAVSSRSVVHREPRQGGGTRVVILSQAR